MSDFTHHPKTAKERVQRDSPSLMEKLSTYLARSSALPPSSLDAG
jgi:hypothetical protein